MFVIQLIGDSAQARKFATRADAECRVAAAGLRDHWERVEVVEVGEDGAVVA